MLEVLGDIYFNFFQEIQLFESGGPLAMLISQSSVHFCG